MAAIQPINQQPNYRLLLSTRRYLFIAIAMSLVAIGVFFLFVFPRIQLLQEHRQTLQSAQEELVSSQEKLNLLQNVNQTELFQEKDRIQALLPNSKPLLPLIARLERLSNDTSVVVTSFDVSPGELSTDSAEVKKKSTKSQQSANANVAQLPLSLVIYGTIDNIYLFLEGIDTLTPLADISSISLSSTKNPQAEIEGVVAESIYEAKLAFQAYYFVGSAPQLSQKTLPMAQLKPDLLQKLQAFVLPDPNLPQTLPSNVTNGGKINLFE